MDDFSHPRAWHEWGHRGSCCCFQTLKRPITYSLLSFLAQEGLPQYRTRVGRPSSAMKYSSARAGATYTGKQFSESLLARLWIFYQMWWMVWPQGTSQPQREEYTQISPRLLASECCVLSHGQTGNFHRLPICSQGAPYVRYPWTTNMQTPSNPSCERPGTACGWSAAGWGGDNSICSQAHARAWNGACLMDFPLWTGVLLLCQFLII